MAAVTRTPRARWIEEALRALSDGGPDAVRIESLARALGVTKGGFYGFFPDRAALLSEMLDTWEREVTRDVIARVEHAGGDARTRLRRLFAIVETGEGLTTGITTDLAIRAWARHDTGVAERLRRVDNVRMDYLRSLFGAICPDPDDAEARCVLVFTSWIGRHFLAADHAGRTRAELMRLAMRRLLLA